jgi:putative ABC transport system permease protein
VAVVFGAIIPADGVPFTLHASRLIGSIVALIIASVIGCAFSLRRVLRVDPASAIGSSS